ncbi:amidohydrolase, partial [Vibrio cholerae]|nr:amidohydrolase [Vibrio cholerae]
KESTRKLVKSQIFQLVNGLQTSFNIKASINYDDNYPVLINNEQLANEAITALTKAKLPEVSTVMDPGPQDPSEDFSYFSQNIP